MNDASREPDAPAAWRLALPGTIEHWCEASRAFEAFLEAEGVPPGVIFSAALVLEEVVTNVIKYAYPPEGTEDEAAPERVTAEREILLEAFVGPEDLVLRVTDDGREFDLRAAPPPDFDAPIEERQVGGLGIHLVRRLTKHIEYARTDGKNVLTLFLSLAPGDT